MTMTLTRGEKTYTPEDLLRMPDGDFYELVNGRLVETGMGALASWVSGQLFDRINEFVRSRDLGWVFPSETPFRCFPRRPSNVRKPDAAFVSKGRMQRLAKGWARVPPDLVVESISPNELYSEVLDKIYDYLDAGVRLIWVIDPGTRTAEIYRLDGSRARLDERGVLEGEDVLPGFTCLLSEILPAVDAVEEDGVEQEFETRE